MNWMTDGGLNSQFVSNRAALGGAALLLEPSDLAHSQAGLCIAVPVWS